MCSYSFFASQSKSNMYTHTYSPGIRIKYPMISISQICIKTKKVYGEMVYEMRPLLPVLLQHSPIDMSTAVVFEYAELFSKNQYMHATWLQHKPLNKIRLG